MPTAAKLPRWRGFNLLEKFSRDWSNGPFKEEDFRMIAELGFNFVRLPLDYRCWIVDGNWRTFNEGPLREIDQAVAWGKQYGIHVNINFHRGPGYCVNPPAETKDLFTDPEAQEVCALHWATFAKRYKGIPNERLSFDLLNEPNDMPNETYAHVVRLLVAAIRREDPDRLVIADGTRWGNKPVPELADLKIGQSTRGYAPMWISHHKAPWVNWDETWPAPEWPKPRTLNGYLYGDGKPSYAFPLLIKGTFTRETTLGITVHQVSHKANLEVRADGVIVLVKEYLPGPGTGEWKTPIWREEYGVWQNVYDTEVLARVPAGTTLVRISTPQGDWTTFQKLRIAPWPGAPGREAVIVPGAYEWGRTQETFLLGPDGRLTAEKGAPEFDAARLWKEQIEPWKALEARGVGIHVGEWGAFNKTPHAATLAWMKDNLANWRKAGWGWALWNFRGSFGILDSDRTDVTYEDFHGHKLDRKMLEVLQAD